MVTEIRPPERSEAVEYLKVLPFANGLPNWEPAPAAWHGGPEAWPMPAPPASSETLEDLVDEVMAEDYRPQAAFVDGKVVGGSGMLSLELTLPGLRQVAMGGVTATGVIATHRRRGLLREMMRAMFADARERGESVAGLSASEGSIYGRFGFAPATLRTRWELDRCDAAFLDNAPPSGTLEIVDAAAARRTWPTMHEAARRHRVGEVSAQSGRWNGLSDTSDGPAGPLRYLVHRDDMGVVDGIASYRLPWSTSPIEVGTLVVEALEATSHSAYSAMWRLLTDFDLTRRVVAAARPADEPLRWMLKNSRAMRVTRQSDNLWIRVLDVAAAMQARSYNIEDLLIFAIVDDEMCSHNIGVWRLDASPTGASCTRLTAPGADLSLDIQALGSLYLGGVSPASLAAAGRITEHREGAIAKLARVMRTDPLPFNAIGF